MRNVNSRAQSCPVVTKGLGTASTWATPSRWPRRARRQVDRRAGARRKPSRRRSCRPRGPSARSPTAPRTSSTRPPTAKLDRRQPRQQDDDRLCRRGSRLRAISVVDGGSPRTDRDRDLSACASVRRADVRGERTPTAPTTRRRTCLGDLRFYRGYALRRTVALSFGYSGSHGCVNLPVSVAKAGLRLRSIGHPGGRPPVTWPRGIRGRACGPGMHGVESVCRAARYAGSVRSRTQPSPPGVLSRAHRRPEITVARRSPTPRASSGRATDHRTKRAGSDVRRGLRDGDTTDELLDLAREVSPLPPPRKLDMLMTAGERISMALVAMAISDLDSRRVRSPARGRASSPVPSTARPKIIDVTPGRITSALDDGHIVIVAGSRASARTPRRSPLGRGGSDTTAVALAAALKAGCARSTPMSTASSPPTRGSCRAQTKLDRLSAEEMLGSRRRNGQDPAPALRRVCAPLQHPHPRALDLHRQDRHHRRGPEEGGDRGSTDHRRRRHDPGDAKVTVVGAGPFRQWQPRSSRSSPTAGLNVDMIVRTSPPGHRFDRHLLHAADGRRQDGAQGARGDPPTVGFHSLQFDDQIGKLSLVGQGCAPITGVSATFFKALADAGVNVEMISTSEIGSLSSRAGDWPGRAGRALRVRPGLRLR